MRVQRNAYTEARLRRSRRNHAGETKWSPLSPEFIIRYDFNRIPGITGIGSMIRMRSAARPSHYAMHMVNQSYLRPELHQ